MYIQEQYAVIVPLSHDIDDVNATKGATPNLKIVGIGKKDYHRFPLSPPSSARFMKIPLKR